MILLFGAKRLPQVTKTLGRVIGEYQRAKTTIQEEVTKSTKIFTEPPKFDRMTSTTYRGETTSSGGTNVEASTGTAKAEAANTEISTPVVTEREKLESIAKALEIEPRGKSTDELRHLIASKINQQ